MIIRLMKMNQPKNLVGRLTSLFDYVELNGELRDSMNISNPQLIVDISATSNITGGSPTSTVTPEELVTGFRNDPYNSVNYVYIPDLHRYYFITEIILIRKNILQFSLHVDVLQFANFIRNQTAFVTRNQYEYNIELADTRRIVINKQDIEVFNITDISGITYLKFDPNFSNVPSDYNEEIYNIVAIGHTTGVNKSYIESSVNEIISIGQPLPNIKVNLFAPVNAKTYLLNLQETAQLLHYTNNEETELIGSISGIYAYPFNFKELMSTGVWNSLETTFSLGTKDIWINHNAHNLKSLTSGYLVNTAFVLENYVDDFNDLEPYSQYELYIPYYGYYTLNYTALRGHTLYLYYVINYQIGSATVILYDDTEDCIVTTLQTQLGIEIPKNTSNVKDVVERHNANNLSLGLGILSSALTVIGGIATENPLMIAGGLMGAGATVGKYSQNERTNLHKEQIQLNGATAPIFAPQNAFIRRTKNLVQYQLTTQFLQQNGGVLNQLKTLSTVNGYTEISEIPNINYNVQYPIPTDNEIAEIINLLKNGVIL